MGKSEVLLPNARKSSRAVAEHQQKRLEKRRELDDLKAMALTELENRGYAVRGKTTSQIREVLRRKPTIPAARRPS